MPNDLVGLFKGGEVRVKQHVPQELLRQPQDATFGSSKVQESAIGDYFADLHICRTNYSDNCFFVLKRLSLKTSCLFRGYSYVAILPYVVRAEKTK